MPAISADDHHSAVNPHKTVQRLLAFALECYFPIIAFTSATHFCSRSAFSKRDGPNCDICSAANADNGT